MRWSRPRTVKYAQRPRTQGGDRRYVGSLVAAIGDIIERHMIETSFLAPAGSAGAKTVVQASEGVSAARLGPCIQMQSARPDARSRVPELRPLRMVQV